ncbi:DUF6392 family protein [Obesumbacterium proteus]|uniref:DUF6392 family protein n=1 Tax=Obesumbacterium proteus TaxID=82983 RepID=UPI00242FD285|nr:DUF6392 family protein [Obesumbacterium proteus]
MKGRSRQGKYHVDHMPSKQVVILSLKREQPDLDKELIDKMADNVAAITIPEEVHRKVSATFGGRNKAQKDNDSINIRAAVDKGFDTQEALKEHGATEQQLIEACKKMHKINEEQGVIQMTVNVELLIHSLGKKYQELCDAGVIPYKSKPKGTQSDDDLSLNMEKEGIFLSFNNDEEKAINEITIRLQTAKKGWVFPNELPSPLQKSMSRKWIHTAFGESEKSIPPKVVMKYAIGWIDRFSLEGFHVPVTMVVRYDMDDMAEAVTFMPTSELRW